MVEFDQIRQQINALAADLEKLRVALNIDQLSDQAAEMEARAQETDFWDDVNRAQEIQTKMSHFQVKIERYNRMMQDYEDVVVLCELGDEAEDLLILEEVVMN